LPFASVVTTLTTNLRLGSFRSVTKRILLPRLSTLRTPLTKTSTFVTRLRPAFSLNLKLRRSTHAGFFAAGMPSEPTLTTPIRMRCGWSPTPTRATSASVP